MENQEILNMLKEINQTTKILNSKIDALNKKVDDNYAKLDKKIDDNYASLSARIKKNYSLILELQKEIKGLRTDIDTVYILEKDSRNKIQQLF